MTHWLPVVKHFHERTKSGSVARMTSPRSDLLSRHTFPGGHGWVKDHPEVRSVAVPTMAR